MWSDFGGWSACSVECGTGVKTSKRHILLPAINGGQNCTGNDTKTETCSSNVCPGIY